MNKVKFILHDNLDNDTVYSKPRYYLYLSSTFIIEFKSRKKASLTLSQVSTFYTEHLRLLNLTHGLLYSKYKSLYFQLEPFEISFLNTINDRVSTSIQKCLHTPHSVNSNVFKYKYFNDVYTYLDSFCAELYNISDSKQEFSLRNDVSSISHNLSFLQEQSSQFSKELYEQMNFNKLKLNPTIKKLYG